MSAPVCHLPARIIPEPAEIINAAKCIEGYLLRRSQPHVPIEPGGNTRGHLRGFETGKYVALHAGMNTMNFADAAVLNELHRLRVVSSGTLLAARLNNAVVLARR